MKTFEIWAEGYSATGEYSPATFLGRFEGDTFRDAVIAWKNTLKDEHSIRCVDVDNLSFWACRLFDNENDARKSFG